MRIFVSYASDDRGIAEPIALSLRGHDHDVFFDRDHLPPGDGYERAIREAIETADLFVFIVTSRSLATSRFTRTELSIARSRWPAPQRRVLAVVAEKIPIADIPPYLRAATLLEPEGNISADVANVVERHYGRPNAEIAIASMSVMGLVSGALSGLALRDLLAERSMAGTLEWLAANPLNAQAAAIVAQGLLPSVLFGCSVGYAAWRWNGRRPRSFLLSIAVLIAGSLVAFGLVLKFGRVPKDIPYSSHLSFARYVVMGTSMALTAWIALAASSSRFRTAEHAAVVIGCGALASLLAMSLLQAFDAINQQDRLPWVFPAAMALWQAMVCAAIGYGFSRAPR